MSADLNMLSPFESITIVAASFLFLAVMVFLT